MINNHNSTLQISRSDLLGWSTTSFLLSLQLSEHAVPFSLCTKEAFEMAEISTQLYQKRLGWVSSSMLCLFGFARTPFMLQHFAFRLMSQVITNQITQWHWQMFYCFSLYRMIYHSIKLKYRASIKLLMATTKIKLESCSLVAPTRDYSRHREHARWLTSLTHCESMPMTSQVKDSLLRCDSHHSLSSPTTPANQSPESSQGLWQYLLTLKIDWLHHKTWSDTK